MAEEKPKKKPGPGNKNSPWFRFDKTFYSKDNQGKDFQSKKHKKPIILPQPDDTHDPDDEWTDS